MQNTFGNGGGVGLGSTTQLTEDPEGRGGLKIISLHRGVWVFSGTTVNDRH